MALKWNPKAVFSPDYSIYKTLSNPRYFDAENITIMLDARDSEGKVVSFLAVPNDPEPIGRAIHANAVSGQYGPIRGYVPVPKKEKAAAK
jgi:hypothetical protein